MNDAVTYGIELLVGLACIGLCFAAWPRGGWLRVAAGVFAVAGFAAAAHAVTELVG